MNTADKRAQLEAAGEPWPICECHGASQDWKRDKRCLAGGFFSCAVRRREKMEARRAARRGAGCVYCGGALETEAMCANHAARHRTVSWLHNQKPKRRLDKYLSNLTYRNNRRTTEGFQPTGAGQAAWAAWLQKGMDGTLQGEGRDRPPMELHS